MYLLIFLATLALSLWATWHVKHVVAHYSQVPATSGLTGAQAAAQIMRAAGINDVQIVEGQGATLGDHYDPLNKRLVLSYDNYYGHSTAALGIAAHETGHAIQHKIAYAPLEWRMAAVGLTNFVGQVMWLPIIGVSLGLLRPYTGIMLLAITWGIIAAFNLVTLFVEFDASRRAKVILGQMHFIQPGAEAKAVDRVLDAAGWTYVAALVTSMAYLLYYLMLMMGGRGRR